MPTRVRRLERFTPGRVIASPRTMISPDWTGSSRFTQRIKVLFPEPEGPHTTTTSPGWIFSERSWRTWSFPNHLLTCLKSMAGSLTGSPCHVTEEESPEGFGRSEESPQLAQGGVHRLGERLRTAEP